MSQKAIPLIDFPQKNGGNACDQARTAASFMRGNESPVVMRNISAGKKTKLMYLYEEWWNTLKEITVGWWLEILHIVYDDRLIDEYPMREGVDILQKQWTPENHRLNAKREGICWLQGG